jgi:NADH-quinone oxidoreductase subunit G
LEDLVTLTVDGQQMSVPKGTLLWEACKQHGIDIPIFCYHTKLGPVGACRTCLVEQEGVTKGPITACSTPVAEGMNIRTRSPITQRAQRGIFEFLLLNHPLDCPICDRAGECPLQDQTFAYGPGTSRYVEPKRHHVKPIALGPTIALDRERCVLCWRCVRFTAEVAEDKSIVLQDRGDHTVVGSFQDQPYVSNFSGNVIELCPVGALTSRRQRFHFRPWELQNKPSICPHCAMGCNINISVRKNDEVIRFLSRDNPDVDDSWLCDRGRFNFEFISSPERLKSPLIRRDGAYVEVSWHEAFQFIADRISPIVEEYGSEAVAGIASASLTNEDLWAFKRFLSGTIGTDAVDHFPRPDVALDAAGAAAMSALDGTLLPFSELKSAKTIVLLGADPSVLEPVMELRIRQAVNTFGARLAVMSDGDITLSSKAQTTLQYPLEQFEQYVRTLTSRVGVTAPAAGDPIAAFAAAAFAEGPIAIVYDDTFAGVTDKGAALDALAGLVAALADRSVGTLPLLQASNSMGARDLGLFPGAGPAWGAPIAGRLAQTGSEVRAAFVLGANLAAELDDATVEGLRALDLLVVTEMMMTDTARLADVILPAASFAEKTGTFTNSERRVQRLFETVPSPGMARAEWQIFVDLSQYFGHPLDFVRPDDIWDNIRAAVARYGDIGYTDIGLTGARPRGLALQPA